MGVRRGVISLFCLLLYAGGAGAYAAAQDGDRVLEKTIAAMIVEDPLMRRSPHIKIKADNGVVYLYGTADSLYDKMQAGLYAQETQGVTAVHNCIKVQFRWPWEDEACGTACEDPFVREKW